MTTILLLSLFTGIDANAASKISYENAKVIRWIDGDTLETNKGTIRLIGVDTPERGKTGYSTATTLAAKKAPKGSIVKLGKVSNYSDKDKYNRKLRYVIANGVDVGYYQISKGAIARYDSRTKGYQNHPYQDKYVAIDKKVKNYSGLGTTTNSSKPTTTNYSKPNSSSNNTQTTCPKNKPIKGNKSSKIYHMPYGAYYDRTKPEYCFATEKEAQSNGFRRSSR